MLASAPDYKVKLDAFEGPLDLLLFLVRREEVELWDIPLEKITQQFLEYLAACEEMDIHLAGDFIVMAATLIYIKSRRLLPDEPLPEGEEENDDVLDPRHELIRRLIEYKRFKEAAAHLQTREAARAGIFLRPPTKAAPPADSHPLQLAELGVLDLLQAFNVMLRKYAARWPVADLQGARFTVADKIDFLLKAVPQDGKGAIEFEELFASAASREEVVVTFLALLELIRLRELRVRQNEPFSSIEIFRAKKATKESKLSV